MANDRYARVGAATGILAVILIMVGYAIANGSVPGTDAPADEWQAWVTDSQSDIQVGTTIVSIGVFFFIWFLGSLRSTLKIAEGEPGRLTSIAYAGGIVGAAFFVIGLTALEAAAFRSDVSADIARGLADVATVSGAPAAGGFTAFFAAIAIVGYRFKAVPAPVAGFSALAALAQPLALGVGITDSGVFASDGFLGLWFPVITFAIAVLTLSFSLTRAAGAPSAT